MTSFRGPFFFSLSFLIYPNLFCDEHTPLCPFLRYYGLTYINERKARESEERSVKKGSIVEVYEEERRREEEEEEEE